MFLRSVLVISAALALTACGGKGGSVTINPPPQDDVCVESNLGLFKAKRDSSGHHYGWCQLDNPHYDPTLCDDANPPVVDDPGDDATETQCPNQEDLNG